MTPTDTPRSPTHRACRGLAAGAACAVLFASLSTAVHPAPPGRDTGERYRSPVERRTFRVLRDDGTGEKWLEADDGGRFASVESILEAESARLSPLERVVAPEVRARIREAAESPRGPGEEPETVAVTLRFARQPTGDAAEAAWAAHGPALRELQRRVRSFLDLLAERRGPDAAPDTSDETTHLTADERAALASAREAVRAEVRRIRREILDAARPLAFADQEPVVERLRATPGAVVLGRSFVLSTLSARVPVSALEPLVAAHPEIARIEAMGRRSVSLDVSVPTIGAETWWSAGYDGSSTTKVAVLDTGIDSSHPWLDGVVSDESVHLDAGAQEWYFDDDETSTDDFHLHGTHVGGIVASNESTSTYLGVAPGVALMNAKCGFMTTDGGGALLDPDIMEAGDWAADNGADVFNCSFGGEDTTDGSSALTLFFDAVADDLAISVAVAAGNSGPSSGTVGPPGDGFNIVSVGNFEDRGSTTLSDDKLASSSSRGPLDDGRRKPDFSAPGTNIRSCYAFWESSNPDFVDLTGTSMASPHVAGSLALLLDAAVATRPEGLKALLMTNLRNTSPAPTSPDDDWGWGALDLGPAYTNRAAVLEDTLTSSGAAYAFYRPGSLASGKRVTLAWARRVVSRGTSSPNTYWSLLDLDLYVYDETTGASRGSSTSALNSVEQVKLTSAASAPLVKVVRAASFPSGLSTQRFAVAAETTSSPDEVAPPAISCAFTSVPSQTGALAQFTVTAQVRNDGDLVAHSCKANLTLPAGYTLVSGSNPQTVATLDPDESGTATWTVRSGAASSGSRTFSATGWTDSYGETFASPTVNASQLLDVDPPTGTVAIEGGASTANSTDVTLNFGASDAHTGVVDLRFRVAGDAWGDWQAFAATAEATLSGGDGTKTVEAQFRDAVGNVSSTASDSIVVDTTKPSGTVTIAGGADWTGSEDVDLAFSASDSATGVTHLRISDDGGANWTPWTAFASTASWRLSGDDGAKTVAAQFRDGAGNVSDAVSDDVGLDRVAPTGTIVVADGAAATNAASAPVALAWDDASAGVVEMRLALDGGPWSDWEPVAAAASSPLPAADGTAVVTAQFRDAAGNVSGPAADDVLVDRTAPSGSFVLAAGAAYLAPGRPLVAGLTASDPAGGAGVDAFRWSHDGGATWSPWVAFAASVEIDVADLSDAPDHVTGEFRDGAGNVSARSAAAIHVLGGSPQDASAAKTVRGALEAGGDVDAYLLELTSGDRLDVRVSKVGARRLDASVEADLFAPDGTLLAAGRHPAGARRPGLRGLVAPVTGTYRLVLRGVGAEVGSGVSYRLTTTIRAARVPPIVGEAVGPAVEIPFEAAAHRTLTGSVRGVSAPEATLSGPLGSDVSLPLRTRPLGRFDLPRTVLAQGSGAYALDLTGAEGGTVRWSLRIGPPRRVKTVAEAVPGAARD